MGVHGARLCDRSDVQARPKFEYFYVSVSKPREWLCVTNGIQEAGLR